MSSDRRGALAALIALAVTGLGGCREKTLVDGPGRGVAASVASASTAQPVPRLVDVGAGKCIPCKAMAPILEQLRTDYAGRMEVVFVDVWKAPDQADAYRIHMIPTQIFYAANGRELARHEGFMSREEILAQWKVLGVEL